MELLPILTIYKPLYIAIIALQFPTGSRHPNKHVPRRCSQLLDNQIKNGYSKEEICQRLDLLSFIYPLYNKNIQRINEGQQI